MQHLQAFTGILQADAYSGYNELYDPSRSQGAIMAALCLAHARRQFFELADIVSRTMQPSVLFEDLRWGESRGSLRRLRARRRPSGGLRPAKMCRSEAK